MNKLGQDLYEVETYKTRISVDTPIQIGFFILQYAKLRMLEFYYDCLNRYLIKIHLNSHKQIRIVSTWL